MLRRLSVENYVLIDKLEMKLDSRLNIITGETGAGKSILLGALGLLLGGKNDGSAMKDAERNCVVEGLFELAGRGLESFFEQNDLDYADQTLIRRMITPAGKSRAFVNDVPVQLTLLRDLGSQLIDIHSQHQNLILSSEEFRTSALDTIAGSTPLLNEYSAHYNRLGELRRQLTKLRDEAAASRRDEEWLRYQGEELSVANLREEELEELEQELAVLSNADQISETLTTLRNAFDTDQTGILPQLKNAERALVHLLESYPPASGLTARLRSVLEELKDINGTVAADSERIDANPERLQVVENRLNTLYSLQQKHRAATTQELIALRDSYASRLEAIEHDDEQIAALEAAITQTTADTEILAAKLHTTRHKAAPEFEKHITHTLSQLGMAETLFLVGLEQKSELSKTGRDDVSFLFSSNRNTTPQPVERIASGGELSRVMLALKALLAERMQLPTIIFDEIDTGVSGRIADAMGEIICSLAATMQVVDITHLPQVASKGETHFVVYKHDGHTGISRLTPQERVTEIAKMLSGSQITQAAMTQAEFLLKKNN